MRYEYRKEASEYILWILIWAVVSMLTTRLFLKLTNWPQIGNEVWHIAHILWGGVGLLAGGMINFMFYGKRIKRLAALVTGIGLGLFVDEAGKFLSRDNDYFFQPTIMIVYVFFIILFLIYRAIEKYQIKSEITILHSILEDFEEVIRDDLDIFEKEKIIEKLDKLVKSENKNISTIAKKLRETVNVVKLKVAPLGNKYLTGYSKIKEVLVKKLFAKKYFKATLLVFAGIYVIRWSYDVGVAILTKKSLFDVFYGNYQIFLGVDGLFLVAKVLADGISVILFGLGLEAMLTRKRRKKALDFFEYGILINIFLSSVFRFYFEQFSGLIDLAIDIGLVWYIREMKRLS